MEEGSKGSLTVIRCDLRNQDDITSMFEKIRSEFGTLHVCVNAAGLSKDAPLLSGDTDSWKEMLDVCEMMMMIYDGNWGNRAHKSCLPPYWCYAIFIHDPVPRYLNELLYVMFSNFSCIFK